MFRGEVWAFAPAQQHNATVFQGIFCGFRCRFMVSPHVSDLS